MKTVLMVAEKPSLAASLANILSNGKCNSRKGLNGSCSVHEWPGTFYAKNVPSQSVFFKMTSVCGHVMSLDFPGKFNNWDKVDPVELFSCPTEKREAVPNLRMVHFLSEESKHCDYLVLWLDCDKEGENICFEVMNAVKHSFKNSVFSNNVTFRAKFSAITEKDIKLAMNNLQWPNENEARSVDARQELDLRIGCAFTRFQTKFFQGRYGNLDASLISYGPCQTPTLAFCVQRHDKIQTFKPEQYWSVQVSIKNETGSIITLDWQRVRMFDKEVASLYYSIVRKEKQARLIDKSSKEKSQARPTALNTVELMRVASSGLNIGPHQAMQIAEKLYTMGYISYPRTETTTYSENFDIISVLNFLKNNSDWSKEVEKLLATGIINPRKGHDAGDHPPITPTKFATKEQLRDDEWQIYDYIVRHFIASISADAKYLLTTYTFDIANEKFTFTGSKMLEPGFTKIMPWLNHKDNQIQVSLTDSTINEVKLVEGQTSPPDYLTESELITLMEKHGIGTDASIPVHINNICQRNYVTVSPGRKLKPTTLGIVLIHGYQKIDMDLILPTMRSAVEKQLNLIAAGNANYEEVLQHTIEVFKQKFIYFVKNIHDGMDQLFEASFSLISHTTGKLFSRCGKCRRYLKYIQTKPQRLHCSQCDETYNLPQNVPIKLYHENKCPLDDFELLIASTYQSKLKINIFCPYCYNYPPFKDMKRAMGCNNCTHPTCSQSMFNTGVATCLDCQTGVLTLDLSSQPKWKLLCNKCDLQISIFKDAVKVKIDKNQCAECNAQLITVEYKLERTKLPNCKTEMTECVFCNKDFAKLIEIHRTDPTQSFNLRNKSRGMKGRRGGATTHKKPKPPKDKMAELAAYFV